MSASADPRRSVGAKMLLIRIYNERGDRRRADDVIAQLGTGGTHRLLLSSPPYQVSQQDNPGASRACGSSIDSSMSRPPPDQPGAGVAQQSDRRQPRQPHDRANRRPVDRRGLSHSSGRHASRMSRSRPAGVARLGAAAARIDRAAAVIPRPRTGARPTGWSATPTPSRLAQPGDRHPYPRSLAQRRAWNIPCSARPIRRRPLTGG